MLVTPTLGMIDSGVPLGMTLSRWYSPSSNDIEDRLGHGRAILATLGRYLPISRLDVAFYKLFERRLTADASDLAAAMEWHIKEPPTWLLCSLGLPRPEARLKAAVERLQVAGTRIIAASPRFGAPVYPAAWPGVIAVSGEAGLTPGPPQLGDDGRWYACVWAARESWTAGDVLQPWQVGPPTPWAPPPLGGASFAAAHALGYWLSLTLESATSFEELTLR